MEIPNTTTNNIVDMNNTALNPVVPEINTGDIKSTGLMKGFNANTMIGIGTCVAVGAAATALVERVLIPVGKKVIVKIKGLRKPKDEVQDQKDQGDSGKDSGEKNEKSGKSGK